jgi:hypothetical protein
MEQPFFMNSASVSSKSILILVTIGNKYDFELRRLLDQNAIKFEGLDFNFVIRLRFFGRLPDERLEEVESSHKCRLSRIIWPKNRRHPQYLRSSPVPGRRGEPKITPGSCTSYKGDRLPFGE